MYIQVIGFIYVLYVLHTLRHIFFYVSDPSKALSWMLFVTLVPVVGVLFFRLLGRSVKRDRYFQRNKPLHNRSVAALDLSKWPYGKSKLVKLLSNNHSSALTLQNKVEVMNNGKDSFNRLYDDMLSAETCIHLEFYIIETGKLFDSYIKLLKKKIAEGVVVRVVYDAFGTVDEYKYSFRQLANIGVEVHEFMPFNILKAYMHLNYRNHRKIAIIDGKVAYTGGMNISDKHIDGDPKLGVWRDTFMRVEGEAASDFELVFQSDWLHAGGTPYTPLSTQDYPATKLPIQVVTSGPDSIHRSIMQEYFTIITSATKYVYISTPYFVPGEVIVTALKTAALSGVHVQLMMPYDSDSRWLRWCMFTYLGELLQCGVKVYLYHSGFLHNKVVISDDIIASVGTANVDVRSFATNFEINAIVYNRDICLELKQHFEDDKTECEVLDYVTFQSRSDRNKFAESLARLTSPML